MESALATLILLTALLFSVLTLSYNYLESQDLLMAAEQEMQTRLSEQTQTGLAVVQTQIISPGVTLHMTVRNVGSIKLNNFDRWDVIVEYHHAPDALTQRWLPYAPAAQGNNQWRVAGIFAASHRPEAFNPGILDPGEEMVIQIDLQPPVEPETMNRITIGAANGIQTTAFFAW